MRQLLWSISVVIVSASVGVLAAPPQDAVKPIGLEGVSIVPNAGQWSDDDIRFGLRTGSFEIAFHDSRLSLHFVNAAEHDVDRKDRRPLTITFPGSNSVEPVGCDEQIPRVNYFVGEDSASWAGNLPSFGAVVYENLYDDIDLRIARGDDGLVKYEFICGVGSDYNQIRIRYRGLVDALCIDERGGLHIPTAVGTLTDSAPLIWQNEGSEYPVGEAGSCTDKIDGGFRLVSDDTYGFSIDGPIDLTKPLVIDPEIDWMSYLGGSFLDEAWGVAVDPENGHLWVTGSTSSLDFEGRQNSSLGAMDAFVANLDEHGALRWMSYLGGSDIDRGSGVAVTNEGNAIVVGFTRSADFVGRVNSYQGGGDAFVVKVTSDGSVEWMTYFGGSSNDEALAVTFDADLNICVAGYTGSAGLPGQRNQHASALDGFALKMDALGTVQWMRYIGYGENDEARDVIVDDAGNWFVAVTTDVQTGYDKGYVYKLNPFGSWLSEKYILHSRSADGIAIDEAGNVFLTGGTEAAGLPRSTNSFHGRWDGYLTKLNDNLDPQWSTYLGGSHYDAAYALALDDFGNLFVTGLTYSDNFEGRINGLHGQGFTYDAFLVDVRGDGSIQAMSYLGGSEGDRGYDLALDRNGDPVIVGLTSSDDFEGRRNSYKGDGDAMIARSFGKRGRLSLTSDCPKAGRIVVAWSNTSSFGQVSLLHAVGVGSFTIPPGSPCAGTTLGLGAQRLQLVRNSRSDAQGGGTISGQVPAAACGTYLQLIDRADCTPSNVVRIE